MEITCSQISSIYYLVYSSWVMIITRKNVDIRRICLNLLSSNPYRFSKRIKYFKTSKSQVVLISPSLENGNHYLSSLRHFRNFEHFMLFLLLFKRLNSYFFLNLHWLVKTGHYDTTLASFLPAEYI